MIHWAWLIPVFIIGAAAGVVLTCAKVVKRKEEWQCEN